MPKQRATKTVVIGGRTYKPGWWLPGTSPQASGVDITPQEIKDAMAGVRKLSPAEQKAAIQEWRDSKTEFFDNENWNTCAKSFAGLKYWNYNTLTQCKYYTEHELKHSLQIYGIADYDPQEETKPYNTWDPKDVSELSVDMVYTAGKKLLEQHEEASGNYINLASSGIIGFDACKDKYVRMLKDLRGVSAPILGPNTYANHDDFWKDYDRTLKEEGEFWADELMDEHVAHSEHEIIASWTCLGDNGFRDRHPDCLQSSQNYLKAQATQTFCQQNYIVESLCQPILGRETLPDLDDNDDSPLINAWRETLGTVRTQAKELATAYNVAQESGCRFFDHADAVASRLAEEL